jgi:hypothetical protein
MFVGDSGPTIEPKGSHDLIIGIIAHCLIWAERDFDRLTPGTPKAMELENLAKSIKARPILPPYHAIPPKAKKRSRNNRNRRGGQR